MYHTDPAEAARTAALTVHARLSGDRALSTLVEATAPSNPLDIRTAAAQALATLHDPAAADALAKMTDAIEPRGLRETALASLVASGATRRAVEVAGRALDDYDPLFAMAAVQALARLGSPDRARAARRLTRAPNADRSG
jgi:HEAT repeat protein